MPINMLSTWGSLFSFTITNIRRHHHHEQHHHHHHPLPHQYWAHCSPSGFQAILATGLTWPSLATGSLIATMTTTMVVIYDREMMKMVSMLTSIDDGGDCNCTDKEVERENLKRLTVLERGSSQSVASSLSLK